jgi:hypothetical protein
VIPLVAGLVALACALASARRLWLVANATALDPSVALGELRAGGVERLRAAADREPRADWERELVHAVVESGGREERRARVGEQLTELDYRIQRWARVPRVCASISASMGFLLATWVLRQGLVELGPSTSASVTELVVRGLIGDALAVVGFGFVGTAFCVAAQRHGRRIARARLRAADELVEALEGCA